MPKVPARIPRKTFHNTYKFRKFNAEFGGFLGKNTNFAIELPLTVGATLQNVITHKSITLLILNPYYAAVPPPMTPQAALPPHKIIH